MIRELKNEIKNGGSPATPHPSKPKPKPKPKPKLKPPASKNVGPQESPINEYSGFIGDAAISLSIEAHASTANGTFSFIRTPDRVYKVTGKFSWQNHGCMKLKIFSDEIELATAVLYKTPDTKQTIEWKGTFTPSDGGTIPIPFYMNRLRVPDPPPQKPATVDAFKEIQSTGDRKWESYEGSVIDQKGRKVQAFFKLTFAARKCYGFYYEIYPNGKSSNILGLEGENPEGVLHLKESDNDTDLKKGNSAELHLTKIDTPTQIRWRGTMTNIRGKLEKKDVEFWRPK